MAKFACNVTFTDTLTGDETYKVTDVSSLKINDKANVSTLYRDGDGDGIIKSGNSTELKAKSEGWTYVFDESSNKCTNKDNVATLILHGKVNSEREVKGDKKYTLATSLGSASDATCYLIKGYQSKDGTLNAQYLILIKEDLL